MHITQFIKHHWYNVFSQKKYNLLGMLLSVKALTVAMVIHIQIGIQMPNLKKTNSINVLPWKSKIAHKIRNSNLTLFIMHASPPPKQVNLTDTCVFLIESLWTLKCNPWLETQHWQHWFLWFSANQQHVHCWTQTHLNIKLQSGTICIKHFMMLSMFPLPVTMQTKMTPSRSKTLTKKLSFPSSRPTLPAQL